MQIALKPSPLLLIVPLGLLSLIVLSMLLKRGDWRRKGLALAVASVVVAAVIVVLYRPSPLRLDERGLAGRAFGSYQVPWAEVGSAVYVEDLANSTYAPRAKIAGVAIGDYRMGWFRLAGGAKARVAAEQSERALVLLHGAEGVLVLAPAQIEGLLEAVSRYRPVDGWVTQ